MKDNEIIAAVGRWLNSMVVGLNLCPFAKREIDTNRVRFAVTDASSEGLLLEALLSEVNTLNIDPSIETTLLIHPKVLNDFCDYNQFLNHVDAFLAETKLEGVFQIASFHPDYQFEGTEKDAAENYTNRSPYPILHILREESLEKAIAAYPDVDQIPARNIECMDALGQEKVQALFEACTKKV